MKDDLGQGFNLTPELLVTNNVDYIRRLIQPEYLSPIIGSLEMDFLLSGRPVVYRTALLDKEEDFNDKLVEFLYEVQAFLQSFWFDMDCSVNNELAFSIHWSDGNARIDSNFLATHFTDAQGRTTDLSFDKAELDKLTSSYYRKLQPLTQWLGQHLSQMISETHRAERALYHIVRARAQSDLGLKITDYCSSFEAFLSTSPAELSHQLAERISLLLAQNISTRISLYKTVKTIYRIRSKIVHGATLTTNELNNLAQMSAKCDDIARNMFKAFFDDQSLREAMSTADTCILDQYHLNKILD